ncbi:hypothetical protein [Salipiger abyssi]|uniref:hypothetical protein n=1 Tax=Salipiger abyssi TaxID=1250539 RepID=UPI001A8DC89D|nr:hypothetical protein [Salipiger abyssi]MBN9890587.1 hypothetical protein [Salipiger abyssi]
MSAPVEIRIVWDETPLTITYRKRRFHKDFDHIELRVDEGFILPVTETGCEQACKIDPVAGVIGIQK